MNITLEFCAEDRALIENLTEALAALTWAQSSLAEAKAAAPVVPVEPVAPAPAPIPEPLFAAPAPASVSLAEFQKALSLRCAESEAMKAKVRELMRLYAPAASQVPEEKRAEVLAKLAQL